jgi:dipeptidase E
MKAILASSGFHATESVTKCVELVGKPAKDINFAIINEAYAVENCDHKWILDDMDSIRNNFGGYIEFVNLLALPLEKVKERCLAADAIFVVGGNTEYLKTIFDKTGFSEFLPELLIKKVYVGSSAGSMILGKRIPSDIQDEIYGEANYCGVTEYMNYLDFSILPHLNSPYWFAKNSTNKNMTIISSSINDRLIYAISDEAAIVVESNKIEIIGNDYLMLKNGNKVK